MRVKLNLTEFPKLHSSIVGFDSVRAMWKTWASLLTSNKNGLICTYSGLPGNHPFFSHSLKTLQMCKFHLTSILFLWHITSPLCAFKMRLHVGTANAQSTALRFSRWPDTHKKKMADSIFFCFGVLFLTAHTEKGDLPSNLNQLAALCEQHSRGQIKARKSFWETDGDISLCTLAPHALLSHLKKVLHLKSCWDCSLPMLGSVCTARDSHPAGTGMCLSFIP